MKADSERPELVEMLYERVGRCLWHTNCPKNELHSGIMRVVKREENRSLLECLHCGQFAYFPVGGVCVRAEAVCEDQGNA